MQLNNCCFCIKIPTAVKIIGTINVIACIIDIFRFRWLGVAFGVFTAVAFVFMMYKDSKQIRFVYMATYFT